MEVKTNWRAFGTGVGIEIGATALTIAVVRVRPSGKQLVASTRIEGFQERPATQWGTEYADFLRKAGVPKAPANILLPRAATIVRQISLPGVAANDLAAAVSFQIDSLHPYADGEAAFGWAQLPGSPVVLIGIAPNEIIDHYANLFTEAGIAMAGFTVSAGAIYSALRMHQTPPKELLAFAETDAGLEAYGESPARPVFSGVFQQSVEQLTTFASSELRASQDLQPSTLATLLGLTDRDGFEFAFAAAAASACSWLGLPLNLLPAERRTRTNRLAYVPTVGLAAALLLAVSVWAAQESYQNAQYLEKLQAEVVRLSREAGKAESIDKQTATVRTRLESLDRFRGRPQADADALRELTALIAPPGFVRSLNMSRTEVSMDGEAEQAAELIKTLDASPIFNDSQFSQSLGRVSGTKAESFNLHAKREGPGTGTEAETQK